MELILYDLITEHCDKNIINKAQHGFRNKHSTVTNLLVLLNEITKAVDEKNKIDVITIDFSKAFDSISPNKLIYKLLLYGIDGELYGWIKDFLIGRYFNVVLNNSKFKWFLVNSSVPQWSKLEPLLYILYANDLVEIFKYAKVKMYADDLTIYAIVNNESEKHKLQSELNELCKWTDKWQLSINFNKCSVLHFGYKDNNFTYKLKELVF